jgi:hypothetical protein
LVKQTAEKLRNMWFFTECLGQFVVVWIDIMNQIAKVSNLAKLLLKMLTEGVNDGEVALISFICDWFNADPSVGWKEPPYLEQL